MVIVHPPTLLADVYLPPIAGAIETGDALFHGPRPLVRKRQMLHIISASH